MKLRLVALAGLVVILGGLVMASLWLQPDDTTSQARLPSILDQEIEGVEFQPSATAEKVLEVAQREVDGLTAKYPRDPAALSAAARRAYQLGETERAAEAWLDALSVNAHFAEALYGLGLMASESDQFDDAIGYFEDVNIINAGDPRVPIVLADSLLHVGKGTQATLVLEQHISSEVTSIEAWQQLGQAHLQTRNYARAIACFERVVASNPDSKDAHYGLARALAATGQKALAEEHNETFRALAEAAREKNAADANAFSDLGYAIGVLAQTYADVARVEQSHSDFEAAERALLRAVKLDPSNDEYLLQLQRLYLSLGRSPEAASVGEKIVELLPADVQHWITLGGLYATLERPDPAIAAFEMAIELDPTNELCQKAKQIVSSLRQ